MDMVGGLKTSEKYGFVNWDDDIPNIWENKKCSKPPSCSGWETLGAPRENCGFIVVSWDFKGRALVLGMIFWLMV